MYKLSLAASSSTSLKSNKRPGPPERAVSDSVAPTIKSPLKGFSSPFKRSASPSTPVLETQRPPTGASASSPLSAGSTSSSSPSHAHSNSVPFLTTMPHDISASSSRSSALLDPRASALVRQRTTSSPGFHSGAMHMAKLANGNIRTFAAKAKRHISGMSQHVGPSPAGSSSSNNTNRTPSPLARISKGFPSRNRSASQPLSSRGGGDAASPTGAPASSPDTVFGLKLPADKSKRNKVFGLPLQDAVKATRLISPDRLEAEQLLVSATRSSVDLTDRARQRIEAKAYLPAICVRALEYVEDHVSEEGLYRVSGSHLQVQQLKSLFDAGLQLDLRTLSTSELDPHSVTGVFKLWMRQLPNGMMSPEVESMLDGLLQQELGMAATTKNGLAYTPQVSDASPRSAHWSVSNPPPDLIDKMAIVFATLSLDRWHLLRELAYHLGFLASHSDQNKMTLGNLRLILSPTMHLSPAMLQILVEQRRHLFDRERAHALATPTGSPTGLAPPRAVQDPEDTQSAPPALKTFATQQADVDADLRAEWKAEDLPPQRTSTQSGPLPPIASRFAGAAAAGPSSSSARAPSPATSSHSRPISRNQNKDSSFWVQKQSEKSDETSTTRGSRTSVSTLDFTTRRRSRSLSALGDLARTSSAADLNLLQPTVPSHAEAEDSEAEDLASSASSATSDRAKSILTVDTSGDEGRMKRSASSMSHTLSDDGAEVLQVSKPGHSPRAPSPVPSLSLSLDTFGGGLLDGDSNFSWSEKR